MIKCLVFTLYALLLLMVLPIKLNKLERVYAFGFPILYIFTLVQPFIMLQMEFLPLMLTSTYCALGTIYTFLHLYLEFTTLE